MNHRATSGPLSPKPNSWPIYTSPKALYEAVIMDRGIAGTATSDPAASLSSLSDLSGCPRDERADVKWGHNIVAASFWNQLLHHFCRIISSICIVKTPYRFLVLCSACWLWMRLLLYSPVAFAIFGEGNWCNLRNPAEETKEFAEPLCTVRNPDSKAKEPEVAGFGCSPTKNAFPATNLPCKNRRKRSLEEGLGHSQAVWGWTNTRVR